ncbi:FAD-binding oxidoreductase [Halobacteriaceae archaeon GCM10025711]
MSGEETQQATASTPVDEGAIAAFERRFDGTVVRPGDPAYRNARRVWNGMVNRYPALIAECAGVGDVVEAVNFAREHDVDVAVRGGGHNVAGNATIDGGLVIDLSAMDAVDVDPEMRTVRAEGGATWADVDRLTQRFGLATPGGVVSDTGIAGLTLGGGMGHLRRKYGLSSDNLVSANVVTADGDLVVASGDRNEDLFWALRGGGGNFGVVTSFEYRLHEVGPEVATLFVWYPGESAVDVLRQFRDWAADAPDEVSALPFYAWVPPLEEFPEDQWGAPALAIIGMYAADPDEGMEVLGEVCGFTTPIVDFSGPMNYVELQRLLDEDYPHGRYYYWKSLYLDNLEDDVIERIVELSAESPSTLSTVDLWHLGGAIETMDEDATAYARRDAPYLLNFEANWDDPRETNENVAWVRDGLDAMRDLAATGGLYVNFPGFGEEGEALLRDAYGDNYDRLVDVKTKYDPENVFRSNQNIPPAA